MKETFSFIGIGNMGGAILKSACGLLGPKDIFITDKNTALVRESTEKLGCVPVSGNLEAAEKADFVMLCVKPQIVGAVLSEIAPVLKKREDAGTPGVLVSIAAGVTIESLRAYVGQTQPIVRVMPNAPAMVGKGLSVIAVDGSTEEASVSQLEAMLKGSGETMYLSESLMDQATAAASCSPAFVYMFIEALADAGVMTGLSRKDALKLSAGAVWGAASMVLETDMGPGELKDMVCSPSGSTIRGVAALEEAGFRGAVIKGFMAAYERNVEMGQ